MEAAGRAPFRREGTHALAVCEIQSCKSHGDDLAASARQSPAARVRPCCLAAAAAAAQHIHQHHFRFIQCAVRLKQHHGNIHIRNGIAGSLIHALAQLVVRLVYTGGVQQHILQRPPGDHAGNAGAGGLRLRGDDSHFLADQEVRQAGFAHVRPSDDSNEYRGGVVMLLNGCCSTQSELLSCFYVLGYHSV